jgi:hypothetical protein
LIEDALRDTGRCPVPQISLVAPAAGANALTAPNNANQQTLRVQLLTVALLAGSLFARLLMGHSQRFPLYFRR